MDWLLKNLQIVAIAVFVVGTLFKKFMEAKAEADEARRQSREETIDSGEDAEWGEPRPTPETEPWSPPPPPLPPRTPSPPPLVVRMDPRPTIPPSETEPYAGVSEELLKRQLRMQDDLERAREAKRAAAASAVAKSSSPREPSAPSSPRRPLRSMLAERSSLRQAVLLREVLGPPVGLR